MQLNVAEIRKDFPQLESGVIYFDNAATSLVPICVNKAISNFYASQVSNVGRGVYTLAQETTKLFEDSRVHIAQFFGTIPQYIFFGLNASDILNKIAYALLGNISGSIITTTLEHHSNFAIWKHFSLAYKKKVIIIEFTDHFDLDKLLMSINDETSVVALTHCSNVTGEIIDIAKVVQEIRKISKECFIIIDISQSAPHIPLQLDELGIDAAFCSAHKFLGPFGVGVGYIGARMQKKLTTTFYGGGMIYDIKQDEIVTVPGIQRFEVGTPNIGGVIGTARAVAYLEAIGMEAIHKYEQDLAQYCLNYLKQIEGCHIILDDNIERSGIVSFYFNDIHAHDVVSYLDVHNIALRAGVHCAQPYHKSRNIIASLRCSFYIYNTKEEIEKFYHLLCECVNFFRRVIK